MYGNCSNALYARDKARLSLAACWAGIALAAGLPPRARARLGYAYNVLLNPPLDGLRIAGAWLGERVSDALIFILYWVVLGACALAQRAEGTDWLGREAGTGSLFRPREDDGGPGRPY